MSNLDNPVPTLKLNDGNSMPMLAFGTGTAWYKRKDFDQIDRKTIEAVKTALKLGYTHLDAAEMYQNEREVGTAIKESKVEREKLYITTKISPESIDDIPTAVNASLKKLGVDYVDLYLIHVPFFAKSDDDLQKAWKGMEAVKASGKARSIGVSNYIESQLTATLAGAQTPPAVNQIEFHPYLQHSSLLSFLKSHNIAALAFGPLTAVTKAKPGPCDDLLAFLAKKYYVSESEISLKWCIDQGVAAVTTSTKGQRLSDYLRAMTFSLTPKEVGDLGEAGDQKHFRGFWTGNYDAEDRS